MNRGLRWTAGCCLAGAALLLIAASRTWVSYDVAALAPLPGRQIHLRGSSLATGIGALGWLGLASVAALAATRGWGRRLVGLVLALSGAGIIAVTARLLSDPAAALRRAAPVSSPGPSDISLGGWPWVVLVGGLLLLLAGLAIAALGQRWTAMGTKYDAPGGQRATPVAATEAEVWQALDRGEDPTGD